MDSSLSRPFPARAEGILPPRLLLGGARREFLRLLACAAALLPAYTAHAQGAAMGPEQTRGDAVQPHPGFSYLGQWPGLIRSAFHDALAPVLSSLNDFLRPVRNGESGWDTPSPLERSRADTVRSWPDLARATGDATADTSALALQRPALSLGYAGVGPGVGLMHFRIPWLVTPESAMRAMPTLSLAAAGSLRIDLMGGNVGGRSGASAAYGRLVYRF